MKLLSDSWFLFLRLVRGSLRMPVFVIISIVQPVLWVVLFGQLFGRVTQLPGFESSSYVQFLAPGIAVMTALFGGAYSGLGMLADIERGVLDRFLATPTRAGAIVAGRLLHTGTQVLLQSSIILGVAALLGAHPHGGFGGLLFVLVAAALLGAAFGGFSNALALLARKQELVIAVMNFLILPMTFLSSMIMSRNVMPGWIRRFTAFNPVDWAVEAGRNGFETGAGSALDWHFALLATFALLCAGAAVASFRRYRRSL